ncbi:response regulator [Trichocoleus sp. FACHB-591]|uniref:response regulator n=1 Tax=unclassified Trichocoleus TaxID=2628910 RepID=UPI001688E427|nr:MULTISPECIES: response regulator [unclassified Trichocoleus]MBD2096370.1 response regulator [Trichocoleus sp. FACHB-591]MBD2121809.1 response regulator [Trichocoleus sp. FACHB-262]
MRTGDNILAADNLKFQGSTILVVDDEKSVLEIMDVVLTFYGAEVIATTSALEALSLLSARQPDLVVSDISMPGMDGHGLIRCIRGLPPEQGGQIPALALTAFGDPRTKQKALTAGFRHFLVKPVDLPELIEVCAKLIKTSQGQRSRPHYLS